VIGMTAQIPDEVLLDGERFSLVGMKGDQLFEPQDFGIIPQSASTACWRGYVMKYHFVQDQLILDEMRVTTNDPRKFNDIVPQQEENLFKYCYKNLNLKVDFTGSILLAKDFIQSMYVHMGFQRPMAFETVVEINIENGTIVHIKDLSKKMAVKRKKDIQRGARPNSDSEDDIKKWIEKTFSLDYD
jgi:hypothetical protein